MIAFMDDPVHLELRASSGTYFKGIQHFPRALTESKF